MSRHAPRFHAGLLVSLLFVACSGDEDPPTGLATTPAEVSDLIATPGIVLASVDAGGFGHTCGFKASGRLFCWGYNDQGQLGSGTAGEADSASRPRRTVPPAGSPALEFTQVSAGAFHTCGVAAGQAYCWGSNDDGSLGNGSLTLDANRPVAVVGGLRFRRVAANDHHTCGLSTANRLYCWGSNLFGELGIGASGPTAPGVAVPTEVLGGRTWISFDVGSNLSCGVATGGQAYCWGDNTAGRLGSGMAIDSASSPVPVAGQYPWTTITTGGSHACTLNAAGQAHCWGSNGQGQLGTGTTGGSVPVPVAVTGGHVFQKLSAGLNHVCGLVASGRAYCWGGNTFGQLGSGGAGGSAATPTAVVAPVGGTKLSFKNISAGASYTCGVATTGKTYCWGAAYMGVLGVGPRTATEWTFPRPTQVASPAP